MCLFAPSGWPGRDRKVNEVFVRPTTSTGEPDKEHLVHSLSEQLFGRVKVHRKEATMPKKSFADEIQGAHPTE